MRLGASDFSPFTSMMMTCVIKSNKRVINQKANRQLKPTWKDFFKWQNSRTSKNRPKKINDVCETKEKVIIKVVVLNSELNQCCHGEQEKSQEKENEESTLYHFEYTYNTGADRCGSEWFRLRRERNRERRKRKRETRANGRIERKTGGEKIGEKKVSTRERLVNRRAQREPLYPSSFDYCRRCCCCCSRAKR